MNSNPKLIVLNIKELIYTVLFIILTIILIFCMIKIFLAENSSSKASSNNFAVESPSSDTQEISPIFSYIEFQKRTTLH